MEIITECFQNTLFRAGNILHQVLYQSWNCPVATDSYAQTCACGQPSFHVRWLRKVQQEISTFVKIPFGQHKLHISGESNQFVRWYIVSRSHLVPTFLHGKNCQCPQPYGKSTTARFCLVTIAWFNLLAVIALNMCWDLILICHCSIACNCDDWRLRLSHYDRPTSLPQKVSAPQFLAAPFCPCLATCKI